VLGRTLAPDEFAAALFAEVRTRWDGSAAELEIDGSLTAEARRCEARYGDDDWTWRA
jgi:hypothetical protein